MVHQMCHRIIDQLYHDKLHAQRSPTENVRPKSKKETWRSVPNWQPGYGNTKNIFD